MRGGGDLRAAGPDQVVPGGRRGRPRRAPAGTAQGTQRGYRQPGSQHGAAVSLAHRSDVTHRLQLTGGMARYDWGINGQSFDMSRPDALRFSWPRASGSG